MIVGLIKLYAVYWLFVGSIQR